MVPGCTCDLCRTGRERTVGEIIAIMRYAIRLEETVLLAEQYLNAADFERLANLILMAAVEVRAANLNGATDAADSEIRCAMAEKDAGRLH